MWAILKYFSSKLAGKLTCTKFIQIGMESNNTDTVYIPLMTSLYAGSTIKLALACVTALFVLFHLLSLALTRFNSRHCSVFSTISPSFLPWAADAQISRSSLLFRLLILALCCSLSCCASDKLYLKR